MNSTARSALPLYSPDPASPIGVFDSGVGGLSVLRALHAELPAERFVYISDSAHLPYGERGDTHVQTRSHAVADWLRGQHGIKALVVACNSATAYAIGALRQYWPDLLLVGIEPALKPASAYSQTRTVGVMATTGTLRSEKFNALLASLSHNCRFVLQGCDGLAGAIEQGNTSLTQELCARYTAAMGPFGTAPRQIDTLVLGCTHYPFVQDTLQALTGTGVRMVEPGAPVAAQTRRLLQQAGLLSMSPGPGHTGAVQQTRYFTTGEPAVLAQALQQWLGVNPSVEAANA